MEEKMTEQEKMIWILEGMYSQMKRQTILLNELLKIIDKLPKSIQEKIKEIKVNKE